MKQFCLYSEMEEQEGKVISITYLWSSNDIQTLKNDVEALQNLTFPKRRLKEHFVITVGRSDNENIKIIL